MTAATDGPLPPAGSRIEVQLHRGMADEWMAGIVREHDYVLLDEHPPGMPREVRQADIFIWRPEVR